MKSKMLHFVNRYFVHTDERGSIEGLINSGNWKEINLVTSDTGIIRGNHYHKKTNELFIILEGEIKVLTQKINQGNPVDEVRENYVKGGDVFIIKPMTNHIFIPLKPSKWINALSEPIDKNNPDFYRIEVENVG